MEGHACSTSKKNLKRGLCAILGTFKLDVVMFYGGDSTSNRTNIMTRKNSC